MEFLHQFFAPGSTSDQWKLNVQDFKKGFTMAVLGAIILSADHMVEQKVFTIGWGAVWQGALTGGLGYLVKNFATPAAPKAP